MIAHILEVILADGYEKTFFSQANPSQTGHFRQNYNTSIFIQTKLSIFFLNNSWRLTLLTPITAVYTPDMWPGSFLQHLVPLVIRPCDCFVFSRRVSLVSWSPSKRTLIRHNPIIRNPATEGVVGRKHMCAGQLMKPCIKLLLVAEIIVLFGDVWSKQCTTLRQHFFNTHCQHSFHLNVLLL